MASVLNKYLRFSMNKTNFKAVVRPDIYFLSQKLDQWIKFNFLYDVLYDLYFSKYLRTKNQRYFFCFNHFVNNSG